MPSPEIEAAAAESELIRDALELAERAHAGQIRNGSGGMPYIDHPVAVAELLAEHGYGEEALARGAPARRGRGQRDQRRRRSRLASASRSPELVEALTDDESIEPYERRKAEHRRRVAEAGGDALAIYARRQALQRPGPAPRLRERRRGGAARSSRRRWTSRSRSGKRTWRCCASKAPRAADFVDELAAELEKLREARAKATA